MAKPKKISNQDQEKKAWACAVEAIHGAARAMEGLPLFVKTVTCENDSKSGEIIFNTPAMPKRQFILRLSELP